MYFNFPIGPHCLEPDWTCRVEPTCLMEPGMSWHTRSRWLRRSRWPCRCRSNRRGRVKQVLEELVLACLRTCPALMAGCPAYASNTTLYPWLGQWPWWSLAAYLRSWFMLNRAPMCELRKRSIAQILHFARVASKHDLRCSWKQTVQPFRKPA